LQTNSIPLSDAFTEEMVDLYVRVSTLEQAEEGYSVEEQESKLRAYCSAMGYNIYNVHIDPGFSGSSLDRPGIKKVISDVQSGKIRKVIVWKLDRLSRSQKDTMVLLEDVFLANDCNFVSIRESFDTSTAFGRAIVGILAAFAQLERENIKERTAMGRQARIRNGYFHGSHAPLGYTFKPGSNDLIVDDYSAGMVREVFRQFLSGASLNGLALHMLNKYGSNIFEWSNTSIRRILKNPVYIGNVTLGDKIYNGIHDSIISETDFYMAAAILEHKKSLDKRDYSYSTGRFKADNLLTGLLFCGDCGARMYARKVSKLTKKYICHSVSRTSKAMIKSNNCTNRLHPYTVEQMDNLIINEIEKISLDRTYFNSLLIESVPQHDDLSSYRERIAEVDKQISRLLNLYQTGIIDMDEVVERVNPLKEEKNKLSSYIEEHEDIPSAISVEDAWELAISFKQAISESSLEDIHCIIHTLIDKIVVLNEDITIYWSFCQN
jgi:site-specific DNA recombinase